MAGEFTPPSTIRAPLCTEPYPQPHLRAHPAALAVAAARQPQPQEAAAVPAQPAQQPQPRQAPA